MFKNSKGFTLIELLVVIFIIGLLASIVIVSVNTARMKARDTRRIQDLDSIRTAVELYIDNNGSPPASASPYSNSNGASWSNLQVILANYIPVLPKDPIDGRQIRYMTTGCVRSSRTSSARYLYKSDGTDYKIGSLLENSCAGMNTNDGGYSNSWYEVGSRPNMPW